MNGFTVFYPGRFTASGFLTTYLDIPIFLLLWIGHKLMAGRNDPWMFKPHNVDLTTGLREVEADAEMWTRMDMAKKEHTGKTAMLKKFSFLWG